MPALHPAGALTRGFGNAWLLLTLASLFWGGNAVAGKFAAQLGWQPFALTLVRWLVTLLVLLPLAWQPMRRDAALIRRHWPYLVSIGAFGMAGFNLFMFLALHHTTAINVAIEQASLPVLIMLANFVLLSQRVRLLQLLGLALSIFGVLVTTTRGEPMVFFTEGLNRGDAIMLLACVFYAGYTFALRWRPTLHWLSFLWWIAMGAALASLPFAAWEYARLGQSVLAPDWRGWLVLLYVIAFPTMISQICYARGVELIGGNRAGLFINLVPLFGSLLAVLLLGESFRQFHAIGLVLVIGGILIAERAAAESDRV